MLSARQEADFARPRAVCLLVPLLCGSRAAKYHTTCTVPIPAPIRRWCRGHVVWILQAHQDLSLPGSTRPIHFVNENHRGFVLQSNTPSICNPLTVSGCCFREPKRATIRNGRSKNFWHLGQQNGRFGHATPAGSTQNSLAYCSRRGASFSLQPRLQPRS